MLFVQNQSGCFMGFSVFDDQTLLDKKLLNAAAAGQVELVGRLAIQGANVNARNVYFETPLYLAVEANHYGAVLQLLRYHADPNIADEYYETPLHVAYENDNPALIYLLLQYGADTEIKNLNNERPCEVPRVPSDFSNLLSKY